MTPPQFTIQDGNPESECTLTNQELAEKLKYWASKLAESGGKSWTLRVPVDFNHDPDMLMCEAANRLAIPTQPAKGQSFNVTREQLEELFGEHWQMQFQGAGCGQTKEKFIQTQLSKLTPKQ